MASGEMTDAQYTVFLSASLGQIGSFAVDGAICFVCTDWRHTQELLTAGREFALKNICIWVKTNAGQGSFYRSQHELVFVFKHGDAEHLNTFELGQHGRA